MTEDDTIPGNAGSHLAPTRQSGSVPAAPGDGDIARRLAAAERQAEIPAAAFAAVADLVDYLCQRDRAAAPAPVPVAAGTPR